MPPPINRLNLRICPADPARADAEALLDRWTDAGIGRDNLVEGGVLRIRAVQMPGTTFLSCGQGGFRTLCPNEGRPILEFSRVLTAWRAGGPRELFCGCGQVHDLQDLCFVPSAAFARSWIEAVGADTDRLHPDALPLAEAAWGGARFVAHRG